MLGSAIGEFFLHPELDSRPVETRGGSTERNEAVEDAATPAIADRARLKDDASQIQPPRVAPAEAGRAEDQAAEPVGLPSAQPKPTEQRRQWPP